MEREGLMETKCFRGHQSDPRRKKETVTSLHL